MQILQDSEPRTRFLSPPPPEVVEPIDPATAVAVRGWRAAHDAATAATAAWRGTYPSGLAGMYGLARSELDAAMAVCARAASAGESDATVLAGPLESILTSRPQRWARATALCAVADHLAGLLAEAARASLHPKAVEAGRAAEGEALGLLAGAAPHAADEVGMLAARAQHVILTRWRPAVSLANWAANPSSSFQMLGRDACPDVVAARIRGIEGRPEPHRLVAPTFLPPQTSPHQRPYDLDAALAPHNEPLAAPARPAEPVDVGGRLPPRRGR